MRIKFEIYKVYLNIFLDTNGHKLFNKKKDKSKIPKIEYKKNI